MQDKPRYLKKTYTFGLALIGLAASGGYAQEGTIEEIIITAEKRESALQDTPIAISAFDQTGLNRAGIDDALDIQFSAPNVHFTKTNFTTSSMTIRGIGNSAIGVSADNGVGIHTNGVYQNLSHLLETEFFDVERVEILRGPQGTLYGRNTTGGVVNVITAKPGSELASDIGVSLGNYDTRKVNAMLNIPLGENISTRLAGYSLNREGYVENLYTGNDIDNRDLYSLRSTTAIQISDDADVNVVLAKFRENDRRSRQAKQQCTKDPAGVLGCLPSRLGNDVTNGQGGIMAALNDQVLSDLMGDGSLDVSLVPVGTDIYANSINPRDLREVYADFDPLYFLEESFASIELNWDIGDMTFVSLSGYSNSYINTQTDYDWTVPSVMFNYPVVGYFNGVETYNALFDSPTDEASARDEQWSQEFRLSSNTDDAFNYTVGLFAMEYQVDNHYIVYFPVGFQFGQYIGLPEEQSKFDNHTKDYEVNTWAVFGEGYWELTDSTRLTLGLRYTDEEKTVLQRQLYLNFKSSLSDPYNYQENDWQEWTGKIGIDSDIELNFTDETLIYATVSRGYKGGGFNPPGSVSFPETFEPEYVNALEVGLKNQLWDNRLQANLTAFYYDFKGLQISKIIQQTSINENVDSIIQGFESEFIVAPNENWRVGFTLSYLDTEIGDVMTFDPADPAQTGDATGVVSVFGNNFIAATGEPGELINLQNNQLPNSPELSANANIEYAAYIGGGYRLATRLQYYWQDNYYSRIFNTQKDEIESWDVIDLLFTLESPSQTWSAMAWVKNLNNDDHITGHYTGDAVSGLYTNVFVLEPRTYGVTVNYSF